MIRQARPAWFPEHLYTFESRFLEIDGSRVHYLGEGSAPPLLMLHGNPTWSFLYRDIVHGLHDRFRCIDKDIAFRSAKRARFEEIFPSHRTVELTGAGHFIQEDAPEEIVAAVRD